MNGYTLEQLLEWSVTDRLIDDFSTQNDTVTIWQSGEQRTLSKTEAKLFLRGLFRTAGGKPGARAKRYEA